MVWVSWLKFASNFDSKTMTGACKSSTIDCPHLYCSTTWQRIKWKLKFLRQLWMVQSHCSFAATDFNVEPVFMPDELARQSRLSCPSAKCTIYLMRWRRHPLELPSFLLRCLDGQLLALYSSFLSLQLLSSQWMATDASGALACWPNLMD